MEIVTQWINSIEETGSPFPRNFDFSFFLMGINRALEFDHHLATSKVIWCLYKCLNFFPSEQRALIVSELLKKYFFRFFFNWSPQMRDIFYFLLLYQIEHNFLVKSLSDIGLDFLGDASTKSKNSSKKPYKLLSLENNSIQSNLFEELQYMR
mmetsp:Transcript_33742/g.32785  ORF Transcript_33742/g.32785 Transcript_33742/m.32785 type:complete len:152 (+) Transcript_33742:2532-2987(+)